jgi:hypothetical protein
MEFWQKVVSASISQNKELFCFTSTPPTMSRDSKCSWLFENVFARAKWSLWAKLSVKTSQNNKYSRQNPLQARLFIRYLTFQPLKHRLKPIHH